MPLVREIGLDRTRRESRVLENFASNVFSQFGEDGVIERLFQIIGDGNRWCVEFGAWDGRYLSNTCNLIENKGWSGVQIEGSAARFASLCENFKAYPNTHQIHRMVGFLRGEDSIDDVLGATPIPRDFDLISIDIDGNDYHIWDNLIDYRPRAVVIEFNPRIPNRMVFVQDRDMSIHQGSSAAALVELGKSKGYELAAALLCNLVFVRRTEFEKLGIADNSLEAMRPDVPGSIFCGFDGTIYNTLGRLGWNHKRVEVAQDGIQLVPVPGRALGKPAARSRRSPKRRALGKHREAEA